jgi:small-conductance mechanosensitive channel
MYTQINQSYYYYDKPEDAKKFFFARCIQECTLFSLKPISPITHKNFTNILLYSLIGVFIAIALFFTTLFFQKMPYGFSICTIFFAIIGILYFYFVFELYRKAHLLYKENPQYALEYSIWQKKIIKEKKLSYSKLSIREQLFKALEADSVLELYFNDLSAISRKEAIIKRIIAVTILVILAVFTFSIEHLAIYMM